MPSDTFCLPTTSSDAKSKGQIPFRSTRKTPLLDTSKALDTSGVGNIGTVSSSSIGDNSKSSSSEAKPASAAALRVLGTTELLEHILLDVGPHTLLRSQRTCRKFLDTIQGSLQLKRVLYLAPDQEKPLSTTYGVNPLLIDHGGNAYTNIHGDPLSFRLTRSKFHYRGRIFDLGWFFTAKRQTGVPYYYPLSNRSLPLIQENLVPGVNIQEMSIGHPMYKFRNKDLATLRKNNIWDVEECSVQHMRLFQSAVEVWVSFYTHGWSSKGAMILINPTFGEVFRKAEEVWSRLHKEELDNARRNQTQ